MPKKLIEVAMPLTSINEASAAEKGVRQGQISNLHPWWARRPQSASRAVLFAQLVDDPGEHRDEFPSEAMVAAERQRLFQIIHGLVRDDGPDPRAVEEARAEIVKRNGQRIKFVDPFAGGGALPVEAQRLGLESEASDLNPVAVLLNRVVIDMLAPFVGGSPRHPVADQLVHGSSLPGLSAVAEDLRWYGKWLAEEAFKKVGALYPPVVTDDGKPAVPIAWIWTRTVPCPNPACRRTAPLLSSSWLSKKASRRTWVEAVVGRPGETIGLAIHSEGNGPSRDGSKLGRGTRFICLGCNEPIPESHIKSFGRASGLGYQLVSVAIQGGRRRAYLSADAVNQAAAELPYPPEVIDFSTELVDNPRWFSPPGFGMKTHASLFTPRQLSALITFADLIPEVRRRVEADCGNQEYGTLLATLLGLCVSKFSELSSALCPWEPIAECPRRLFGGQSMKMTWTFAEGNPFGDASGSFSVLVDGVAKALEGRTLSFDRPHRGTSVQANAAKRDFEHGVVVATDPPYFDNIGYADLSDFFYVWLRRSLRSVHNDLFSTLLVPKNEELVATPYRYGGDQQAANRFFEDGFREVFSHLRVAHSADIPMTIFYAYKQEDDETEAVGASGAGATGWARLLQGLVESGLQVTATWPMRTEMASRIVGRGTNALASSVVLACRPRPANAGITDRQGFIRHLRRDMAEKLPELQSGGVQPVDMAQASIGPGMAVFTSYAKVLEGGDKQMSVGAALQIINQVLDELQTEQESEFDSDTRWAVTWFDQHGMNAADFGDAQNIATARGTAVNALERAGIIEARAGRVRLLTRGEYADDWDPTTDKRLTVWEVCQHLIRRVEGDGGLMAAAALLRQVGGLGEAARDLAYRLYEIANRNGWSEEARAYNNLAAEWPDLVALAAQAPADPTSLF